MEVGQKIKLVRLHRGLTQKQLGDLLNLGDGGANRIAQYEIGYRVPKPSLLKEIAKVLDVKEETFFVSDKFLPDILRTIMWYDFEHRRSFKLTETTLDASIAPIESKTIELRGNACTTWGDSALSQNPSISNGCSNGPLPPIWPGSANRKENGEKPNKRYHRVP